MGGGIMPGYVQGYGQCFDDMGGMGKLNFDSRFQNFVADGKLDRLAAHMDRLGIRQAPYHGQHPRVQEVEDDPKSAKKPPSVHAKSPSARSHASPGPNPYQMPPPRFHSYQGLYYGHGQMPMRPGPGFMPRPMAEPPRRPTMQPDDMYGPRQPRASRQPRAPSPQEEPQSPTPSEMYRSRRQRPAMPESRGMPPDPRDMRGPAGELKTSFEAIHMLTQAQSQAR